MTQRPLPAIDQDTRPYWTGGATGELLIERCGDCRYYVHPPTGFCPKCESRNVSPEAVSGRATVTSFTAVHKQWVPDLPVPYILALVTIDEQDDVMLATNIVDCPVEAVHIGMPVKVRFEQNADIWVPLFAPVETRA